MDTGTGHIFPMDEIKIENVKGNLVEWYIGEVVEVKGCRFKVEEITCFPVNSILLVGIPKDTSHGLKMIEETMEKTHNKIYKRKDQI